MPFDALHSSSQSFPITKLYSMAIVRAHEASSSTFRCNYQVFLSFRGEDTRKTFTDHLYTALVHAGFRTFRDDDEIERGKRLESELGKAIQQSRISIIVLSKNYASSKWCLDELVMILEWSRSRSGHEVLPVFYDVDPSDVRKQTGSVEEAFARYEEELMDAEIDHGKKKEWKEKLRGWKVALREVAKLAGMVLKNQANGYEAKFIQEIVKVVERKLNHTVLYVGRHLVGMDSRVRNVDSWVQDSSSSEHILVICGMGGIGKTTIAKFVYNLNVQRFEGSSFLHSVKEKSQQPNGLVNLQSQLLSSILKRKRKEIYDVDEGIIKISEAICCKRILVVIDDVDEVEQLEALLGTWEFYPGSKIIITTRNKSLLKPRDEVYKLHTVAKLNEDESLALFCWHAFGKECPIEGYLEQSKRVVYYCGGLPLAHKILGSSLAGKNTKVWASTLQKLEAIPETKILNVLKISFDSLQDDHDRNLFLHIACFFVGHNKDEIIEILNKCDFFAMCGIQNLVDRCLISIDKNYKLVMHRLLQEMGWQIVEQESPNEPGRRSRLWRNKDSLEVLKENRGTETIEGLMLDMQMYKENAFNIRKGEKSMHDEFHDTLFSSFQGSSFKQQFFNFLFSEPSNDVDLKFHAFSRMDNLRLLKLNYVNLRGCCQMFPKDLRWLCWHGFPLKSIPIDLPLGSLVSLDMRYSKLEHVWRGNKVILSLKILNLSHSQRLIKTPNFRGLPNLERLILEGCVSLVEVCDTIGNLKRLTLLNLENCRSLRKFPNILMLKSLQTLVLNGFPNITGESMKVLDANGVTVNTLPFTRIDHVKLCYTLFHQWMSKSILKNPEHICVSFPRSLVCLRLRNCNLSDDYFPLDLSNLLLLEKLDLSYNHFRSLPRSIGSLGRLTHLQLNSCQELHSTSGLWNVKFLEGKECRSLESVTHQSALTLPSMGTNSYGKLKEIQGMFKFEPMEKVNREILHNLGFYGVELTRKLKLRFKYQAFYGKSVHIRENICQGLYEFGIFSTFVRGEEIQSWYGDRNKNKGSSSVSFVVPSHPSLRIRGLNMYSVYTLFNTDKLRNPYLLFTKITNRTKDLKWIYTPMFVAIPKKENEEELVWLSYWKFKNHLESGDEVDVSVIVGFEALEVKEFGFDFVWGEEEEEEEEEEEIKATHHHHYDNTRDVIGGDLSSFQFMSPRAFFLSHDFVHTLVLPRSLRMSLFQEVLGDDATVEDLERWVQAKNKCESFLWDGQN